MVLPYSLITGHNGLLSRCGHQLNWQTVCWHQSYVITHHVITHYYYVASDCWSTDSSEKCKQLYVTHRPTCGFQAVLCNTRNATDPWLATQSKNRNRQRTEVKNATHATGSIHACIAFFVCVHYVHCGFLICVAWPACIASVALHTAAWKPTFKSVFIGLHHRRPTLSPFSAFWWRRQCFDVRHV